MKLAILSETAAGDRRAAVVPKTVALLVQRGLEVGVQSGAGQGAFFSDGDYVSAGASVAADAAGVVEGADIVVKTAPPPRAKRVGYSGRGTGSGLPVAAGRK